MGKPKTKSDGIMQKQFAKLDQFGGVDEQFKREEKRVWKKARTRHLRREAERDLHRRQNELD